MILIESPGGQSKLSEGGNHAGQQFEPEISTLPPTRCLNLALVTSDTAHLFAEAVVG